MGDLHACLSMGAWAMLSRPFERAQAAEEADAETLSLHALRPRGREIWRRSVSDQSKRSENHVQGVRGAEDGSTPVPSVLSVPGCTNGYDFDIELLN